MCTETEIKEAIKNGNLNLVKMLTEGQDIIELDRLYWLLKWAVTYQHIDIIKYLLDRGIDINTVYIHDNVLNAAAGVGNIEIVNFLLEKGINIVCTQNDRNPASRALGSDRLDIFKLLLEKEKELLNIDEYEELVEYFREEVLVYCYKDIMEYLGVNVTKDLGKKPSKTDRNKLVASMTEGIKQAIRDALSLFEDEKIYIFSFEIDDIMSNITIYVNSEENLKAQIDDADEEDKEDIYYYKYCEDEWNVIEDSIKYFKKVANYVKKYNLYEDDIRQWDYMILDALRKIREEKYVEKLYKSPIMLTIYMHGHCDENEMIEVFKQINDESTYREYIDHIEDFF
ncbi:MAG: DUF4303 domain-containing protein [Anaeroplasmataceae bacterium]|nr:DUF4303 domain-containing protein [Anaeroplasmataceae bacterium]